MCGICGLYNYGSNRPAEAEVVRSMNATIQHRGPDGEGYYYDGPLGFGHRRLSIIDVAGGKQPLSNEDDTVWITFNGEIYNFRDLGAELQKRGHEFRTRTDTEVIVHGYEEWGDEVVTRLNGMFAFGLWDARRRRLLLARDHYGVKPLYYAVDAGRFAFASELKAILQLPGIDSEFTLEAIDAALRYGFVPSPLTLFGPIRKLAPGHRLVVTASGASEPERYWTGNSELVGERPVADLRADILGCLERAVQRQMMSEVPIGALLSGGVDSTAIVTLMKRHSEHVRTFSVGASDAADLNELAAARATAKRLGTQHEEVEIGMADYIDFMGPAHWHLEEPSTPSAVLTYFVCKMAGRSVKVVLTGQGADEPFAGYARYRGESYGALFRSLPSFVTRGIVPGLLKGIPGGLRWKRGAYALEEADPIRRFNRIYEVFSLEERDALIRDAPSLRGSAEDGGAIAFWGKGLEHLPALDQLLRIDARCSLSDNLLLFGDKMSMAASVEARVPMLDLELMELAESIPAAVKLNGHTLKHLFKSAMAEIVPQEVLRRPKLGFEAPMEKWIRRGFGDTMREVLLRGGGLVDVFLHRSAVERLFDTHMEGRENRWRQIFLLVSLETLRSQLHRPPLKATEWEPESPDALTAG